MVIKVYISGMSGSKEVKKRQQRVTMILDSKHITYTIIDITEPGQEAEKDFMQKNSEHNGATISDQNPRHPLPPQMFNDAEYCGDYDDFDLANEVDNLEVFLKIEAPKASSEVSEDQQKNGTGDAEQDQQSQVTATEAASAGEDDDENKENKTEEGANEPHITNNTTEKTTDDGECESESKKTDEANEDSPSKSVGAEVATEEPKEPIKTGEEEWKAKEISDEENTAIDDSSTTEDKTAAVVEEAEDTDVEAPNHEEPDKTAEDTNALAEEKSEVPDESSHEVESKADHEKDDPGTASGDGPLKKDDIVEDEARQKHLEPVEAVQVESSANCEPQTEEDSSMSETINDEQDELLSHTEVLTPEISTEVAEETTENTEERSNEIHGESAEVESQANESEGPIGTLAEPTHVECAKDPPENDEIENEQDEGDDDEQSDDSDEPVSVMEVTSKVEETGANTADNQGEEDMSLDEQETSDPKEIFSEEPAEDDEAEQRELLEAAAAMGKREDAEEEDDLPQEVTEDVEIAEEDEVSSKLVDTDDPMAEQEEEE